MGVAQESYSFYGLEFDPKQNPSFHPLHLKPKRKPLASLDPGDSPLSSKLRSLP